MPASDFAFTSQSRFDAESRRCKLLIPLNGEMSEWLKEHAWKACVGETLPWVRIPLSPPDLHPCDPAPPRAAAPSALQSSAADTGMPVPVPWLCVVSDVVAALVRA